MLKDVTEVSCCYGNVYWLKGRSLVTHGLASFSG